MGPFPQPRGLGVPGGFAPAQGNTLQGGSGPAGETKAGRQSAPLGQDAILTPNTGFHPIPNRKSP